MATVHITEFSFFKSTRLLRTRAFFPGRRYADLCLSKLLNDACKYNPPTYDAKYSRRLKRHGSTFLHYFSYLGIIDLGFHANLMARRLNFTLRDFASISDE